MEIKVFSCVSNYSSKFLDAFHCCLDFDFPTPSILPPPDYSCDVFVPVFVFVRMLLKLSCVFHLRLQCIWSQTYILPVVQILILYLFWRQKILKCILIFFPSTFQVYSISDQNVLDARHQSQTDLTNKSAKPKKKKKSSKAIKTPKLVKVFIKRK